MGNLAIITLEDIEQLPGRWSIEKIKNLDKLIKENISDYKRLFISSDVAAALVFSGSITYDKDKLDEYYNTKMGTFCGFYRNDVEVYIDLDSTGIRFG